ncbi:MAG: hypothetical protein WC533_01165 [Candidatus Pacearchaeota archaeon]
MESNITESIADSLNKTVNGIKDSISPEYWPYVTLCIVIALVIAYSIFIWKFHKFLSKRDILELDLSQYNNVEHELLNKLLEIFLYIVEYIVILPILVLFWFFVMAVIILLLAREQQIGSILMISACIISVIRIIAYYNEELAKDLAKLLPFNFLAIALVTSGFFDSGPVISKISQIPSIFEYTFVYLFVIMAIEFLMRIVSIAVPNTKNSE